jgi:hypothetical protein
LYTGIEIGKYGGEVQCLVHITHTRGAVAEEGHRHRIFA